MQIQVTASDANNIICQVTPTPVQTVTIDRGVAGNGIVSIVPVTIGTLEYLRITYTNGTVSDVGPITSTAYTAVSPISIVGNTISLLTVPISLGGTGATTAAAGIQNLLPSYTGNGNKRLGLNSGATALEWVSDGGGTVTSVAVSGGTTGLTTTGGPITGAGTITLTGTLATTNGGTGLSAFTANGVFYASSTSAIAQSANLTFNGTTLSAAGLSDSGNLTFTGTGNRILGDFSNATLASRVMFQTSTTNSATTVGVLPNGTSTASALRLFSNTDTANSSLFDFGITSTVTYIGANISGTGTYLPMTFYTGGSERVRIDTSGNVGVGTTATLANSTLNANAGVVARTAAASGITPFLQLYNGNAGTDLKTWRIGGSFAGGLTIETVNDAYSAATARLVIDAAGNAGIGTSSPGAKLQVQSGTLTNPTWAASDVVIAGNSTGNSTFYQTLSDVAGGLVFSTPTTRARSLLIWNEASGNMSLTNGASGSIVFTNNGSERMRIDSSGNVGIGVSSVSSGVKLDVDGTLQLRANGVEGGQISFQNPGNTGLGMVIDVSSTDNGRIFNTTNNFNLQIGQLGGTGGTISLFTGAAERIRIDGSGNVGVGTATPTAKFNVVGGRTVLAANSEIYALGVQYNSSSGVYYLGASNSATPDLLFSQVGGSERMRLTNAGDLLVGCTALPSASVAGISLQATKLLSVAINTTANTFVQQFFNPNGVVGSITLSGSAASFNTSSDYRLKHDIQPMTGALAKIAALKPVTYKWNADGSGGEGFIAHELAEVVPQCVTGEKDAVDAEGKPVYQGIDTSFLVATLTAAIQELKAEFDAYKATHP